MESGLNNSNFQNSSFLSSLSMKKVLEENINSSFRNDIPNNWQMSFENNSLEEDINRESHEEDINRESHEENIIKDDKEEKKSEDKIIKKEKKVPGNIKKQKTWDIDDAIINVYQACIRCIENGDKIEGSFLINITESLKKFFHNEEQHCLKDSNYNAFGKVSEKINIIDEIFELKIKKKNEEEIDSSDIRNLKERIISFFEEKVNDSEFRKQIKNEAKKNSDPFHALDIAIKHFFIYCLNERVELYMKMKGIILNKKEPEKDEKNFLEKKRNNDEINDEDSEDSEKSEKENANPRIRADNINISLIRNLIQKIFINWINFEEKDKDEKIMKLNPIIFNNLKNLKGKQLKEIYSQELSSKLKNIDKNHNINIIQRAEGIKAIKLNLTFEQALKLFYYKEIDDDDEIIDVEKLVKGLKGKEEYLNEKGKKGNYKYKEKLEIKLEKIIAKYLEK